MLWPWSYSSSRGTEHVVRFLCYCRYKASLVSPRLESGSDVDGGPIFNQNKLLRVHLSGGSKGSFRGRYGYQLLVVDLERRRQRGGGGTQCSRNRWRWGKWYLNAMTEAPATISHRSRPDRLESGIDCKSCGDARVAA